MNQKLSEKIQDYARKLELTKNFKHKFQNQNLKLNRWKLNILKEKPKIWKTKLEENIWIKY